MTVLRSAALRAQGELGGFLFEVRHVFARIVECFRVSAYLLLFVLLLFIDGLWSLVASSKTTLEDLDGIEQD